MKCMKRILSIALLTSLGGCIHDGSRPPPETKGQAALTRQNVVDLSASCNFESPAATGESFLAALLLAVAPTVIDKGYDLVANAFREAGRDKAVTHEFGSGASAAYKLERAKDSSGNELDDVALTRSDKFSCLRVMRGALGKSAASDKSLLSNELKRSLKVAGDPEFLLEATVEFAPDQTAFRIAPKAFMYRENLSPSTFFTKERDLLVTFSFSRPTADTTAKPFAFSSLRFNKITPANAIYGSEALNGITTPWMPLPPLDNESQARMTVLNAVEESIGTAQATLAGLKGTSLNIRKKRDEISDLTSDAKPDVKKANRELRSLQINLDGESAEAAITRGRRTLTNATQTSPDLVPINVAVSVIETRNGDEFLKFVGEVLTTSGDSVKNLAKAQLPDAREARRAEEERRVRATQDTILSAQNELRQAEADLADLPTNATNRTRVDVENRVRGAKLKVNRAFKDVGRTEPYHEVVP